MKGVYSYEWLQSFFSDQLPSPDKIGAAINKHSFEVEEITKHGDDTIFVLDVLPDRASDCLAHYGIAKEISAIFSLPLAKQYFKDKFPFAEKATYIQTKHCDRYTIIKVEGIDCAKPSEVLTKRLEAIGQRSVGPIVDITNYILFDIGQPIHSFDAKKVSGNFSVRQAKDGETLTLLGDETVTLQENDIVITDNDRAIALAGIKGGEDTKTDETTKDVFIEIATFDSTCIRNTMRRIGHDSEAAQRFSQGRSAEIIDYTAHQVAKVFGTYGSITDSYDSNHARLGNRRKTGVSLLEVNKLLGTSYKEKSVGDIFDRLGLSYEYINPRERFLEMLRKHIGKPYLWGASVTYDAPNAFDCSSLVSWCAAQAGRSIPRMAINQYFFSRPVKTPKAGDLLFTISSDTTLKLQTKSLFEAGFPVSPNTVKDGINHVTVVSGMNTMIGAEGESGENKVMEKEYAPKDVVHSGSIFDDEKRFVVTIPVERPDIRDENDLIEEISRIQGYDTIVSVEPEKKEKQPINQEVAKRIIILKKLQKLGFSEVMTYSFCKKGDTSVAHPVARDKKYLRSNLRQGILESLEQNAYNGELLGLADIRIVEIGSVFVGTKEKTHVAIGVQETLGRAKVDRKEIEEEIKKVLPIKGTFDGKVLEVELADIQLDASDTYLYQKQKEVVYTPPSKYPFILRDIALFVKDSMTVEEVEEIIKEHSGEYLRKVNLFDCFEKDGKKSYAFRLVFQSDDMTLTDTIINERMSILVNELHKKGGEVR